MEVIIDVLIIVLVIIDIIENVKRKRLYEALIKIIRKGE